MKRLMTSQAIASIALAAAFPTFAAPTTQPALPTVGSSRVDLQACKLEYSIVSPK